MSAATARPFAELFGGRPGDGDIASLARAAARAGYAVLPIKPGTKQPLCTLTARQATAADKKAADAARDAGKRNWERVRHPCGKEHATTDPAVAHRVFKRLASEHPDLNLAVEVYRSRVLVVDADTSQQLRSFTALWAAEERHAQLANAAPTVRSPGEVGPDGQWKHSDGGHFWFLLDDDIDIGDVGNTTSIPIGADLDNQAQLKISGYVLVPPSVRPEGEYRMASDAHVAPTWLVERVQLYLTERRITRAHRADRCLDADDTITLAQSTIPWSAILEPRGWSLWYKVDRCGCEIWTAPGEHASPKSGTFHDSGCAQYDTADGFGHVWTDNPPDGLSASGLKTFSKIQFVAWSDHAGDMGSAMAELGIERKHEGSEPATLDRERISELLAKNETRQQAADDAEEDRANEDEDTAAEQDPVDALLAELIPASELDKIPPPVPLVEGLLDCNSLARVVGKPGHGKSFFMIDIAGHVALGKPWHGRACTQGDVVYMVAEGAQGIRKRIRAWERHHGLEMGERVKFLTRPVQVKDHEWLVWIAAMAKLCPTLIVIDTQARVTAGANENGPEDMGLLVRRADELRIQTGACVVLVHHKGHQGDHGRGWSGVLGALDAEIEVAKEGRNKVAVLSSKQKDQEDFEPIRLDLIKVLVDIGTKGSAVLVEPGSDTNTDTDPFDSPKTEVGVGSSARDRVAAMLYRTYEGGSGATKGELKAVVLKYDRGRDGRPMSRRAFDRAWSDLEADGVLVAEGSRFQLSLVEADRLGLRDDS